VGFGAHVCYHCRISPPHFLAECRKRRLNQGSFVLLFFRLYTLSDLYLVFACLFSCTAFLPVSVKRLAVKTASEMTYIVSGGALNSTHSLTYKRLCDTNNVLKHLQIICRFTMSITVASHCEEQTSRFVSVQYSVNVNVCTAVLCKFQSTDFLNCYKHDFVKKCALFSVRNKQQTCCTWLNHLEVHNVSDSLIVKAHV